jgi:anti-sigma B factor antagonist
MEAKGTPAPRAITRTSTEHGDAMLSARGAFDRDNRNELISVVEASFADGHRTVVLDVSQVTFIDASVVNALVNCEEDARAQGRTLRLLNPGPATAQILIDTGTFTALCGYRRGGDGATAQGIVRPATRRDAVIDRAYQVLAASRRMVEDVHEF